MVYLFVGAGGIIGSLIRYLLSNLSEFICGKNFPIGTLVINLSGAFLLGWFSGKFVFTKKLRTNLSTAISTGVIGSYTTFSTFSVETARLLTSKAFLSGFIYMAISLIGGLFLVRIGLLLSGNPCIKKERGK